MIGPQNFRSMNASNTIELQYQDQQFQEEICTQTTFSLTLPNAGRWMFVFIFGLKGIYFVCDKDTFGSKKIYMQLFYIKNSAVLPVSDRICQYLVERKMN